MIGRVAPIGGTWLDDLYSTPAQVASDVWVGVLGGTTGAKLVGVGSSVLRVADWWLRITFIPRAGTGSDQDAGLWFGDATVRYFGLFFTFPPVSSGPVEVQGGNGIAPEVDVTFSPGTLGVSHELVFQWSEATSTIEVFYDDVSVGSATGVTIDALVSDEFGIVSAVDALGPVTEVTAVEVGRGVYS